MLPTTHDEKHPYDEYVRHLVQLHFLIRDGKGDEEEADLVRDQMDVPWYKLSPGELRRVKGISSDLYTLEPESPIVHPSAGGITSPKFAAQLQRARTEGRCEDLLDLLRTEPECISADRAAFLRGWCYEQLGDSQIAAMFYDQARKLDQRNDLYAVFALAVPSILLPLATK